MTIFKAKAMALRSEFDSMEETLRDALRQGSRKLAAKNEMNKRNPVCDNTITKRHNYITVYEHEPQHQTASYRNIPSTTENLRPFNHSVHGNMSKPALGAGTKDLQNISVEEFERYCSLLTERIQKMEEHNVELVKFAEQQKAEYEKVVAQVMESEKSQRLLLSECSSLRKQVQALATHNKKLKEQKFLSTDAQFSNRKDSNSSVSNGMVEPLKTIVENPKEALMQLHGHNVPFLDQYKTLDVASIVGLYAALQKDTLNDIKTPEVCEKVDQNNINSFDGYVEGISVARSVPNQSLPESRNIYEDPDYALPSNICTSPSCTRCLYHSLTDSQDALHRAHANHNGSGSPLISEHSNRLGSLKSNSSSSHCFDNNSYVEVELKPGSVDTAVSEVFESTVSKFSLNSNSQHAHNHYANISIKSPKSSRPSNLEQDNVLSSQSQLPGHGDCKDLPNLVHSPLLSPKTSRKQTRHVVEPISRSWAENLQSESSSRHPKSRINVFKKTSTPMDETRRIMTSSKKKKYSRSASTSDLPPPPPPPPMTSEPESYKCYNLPHTSASSPSIFTKDRSRSVDHIKQIGGQANDSSAKTSEGSSKLSVWKFENRTQQHLQTGENDADPRDENNSRGRRGSYSRACRLSQSLDHLYEQLMEEEPTKSHPFSSKKLNNKSPIMQPALQAPKTAPKPQHCERKNSPTFAIQESASTATTYEVVMPVHRVKTNKAERKTSQTAENFFSTSSNKSSVHSQITAAPYSAQNILGSIPVGVDSVLADDAVFLPNKEKLRRRRFSEGSTGNKQKDKLYNNDGSCHIQRQRSTDSDVSLNKRRDASRLQSPSITANIPTKTNLCNRQEVLNSIQQPQFPATNPYAKRDVRSFNRQAEFRPTERKTKQSAVPKAESVPSQKTDPRHKAQAFTSSNRKAKALPPPAIQKLDHVAAEEMTRGRNEIKSMKANKETDGNKKANSGTAPTKSFVSLMKAKFSRSSPPKSTSPEKKQSKAFSAFPVTPASSLIDPRTLSLEPNTYLAPDTDEKKNSKQVLGEHSDAAVGRKLSQPFPNGIGENIHQTPLNKVTEEPLSDEGFAEGSTVDRPAKSELHVLEQRTSYKPVRRQANYMNVEVDYQNPANSSRNEVQNYSNKSQSHCKNITAQPNAIEKHFEFAEPSKKTNLKNLRQHLTNHKPSANQQHYESYKLTEKIESKPLQTGTDNSSGGSHSHFPSFETNHLRAAPSSQIVYSGSQIKVKSSKTSKNIPKVGENLKDGSTSIKALQRKTGKDVADKGLKPIHQNDAEKEFINSIVQAELCQRQSNKSALETNFSKSSNKSKLRSPSSGSSGGETETIGSIGTISSIGSFPSDAFESANSTDPNDLVALESSQKPFHVASDLRSEESTHGFKIEKVNQAPAKSKLPSSRLKSPSYVSNDSSKIEKDATGRSGKASLQISLSKKNGIAKPEVEPSPIPSPIKLSFSPRPSKIATCSKIASPNKTSEHKVNSSKNDKSPLSLNYSAFKTKRSPLFYTSAIASSNVTKPQICVKRSPGTTEHLYENSFIINRHKK